MKKNEAILMAWCIEAYEQSNIERIVNLRKLVKIYLEDNFLFSTIDSDKDQVISWMIDDFLGIEKVCSMMDKGEISQTLVSKGILNCCVW